MKIWDLKKNDFPIAEKLHKEIISIPIYPSIQVEQQDYVLETLKKVINNGN